MTTPSTGWRTNRRMTLTWRSFFLAGAAMALLADIWPPAGSHAQSRTDLEGIRYDELHKRARRESEKAAEGIAASDALAPSGPVPFQRAITESILRLKKNRSNARKLIPPSAAPFSPGDAPLAGQVCETVLREELLDKSTAAIGPNEFLPSIPGLRTHVGALAAVEPGALRGQIDLPVWKGKIASTGKSVYFVLSDTDDIDFASEFGILATGAFDNVDPEALDEGARFDEDAGWVFSASPGSVAVDETTGAKAADRYTPLIKIKWRGRDVIVNAPQVLWGQAAGQCLVVVRRGCNMQIRKSRPDQPYRGGGPEGCKEGDGLLSRFQGGQVLAINLSGCADAVSKQACGSVTMKLHRGHYRRRLYPYLVVFGASQKEAAEQLGVPHVPRLRFLAGGKSSGVVGSVVNFINGVTFDVGGKRRDGGFGGFQPMLTRYGTPTMSTYTPFVSLTNAAYDCDLNGEIDENDLQQDCAAVARLVADRDGFLSFDALQTLDDSRIRIDRPKGDARIILNAPSPLSFER